MQILSITPIFTSPHLRATRDFYVRHFGFQPSFVNDHYLGLRTGDPGTPEIGFMAPDEMAPDVFDGRGACLSLLVADVDAAHAALVAADAPILLAPTDRPWGARTMSTRDPAGVVVNLSQSIPMSPEFADCVR